MLRLYKSTIIASFILDVVALGVGIICELLKFPHNTFIQNLAIGVFCSLLVVVITSMLQYRHEHKEVYRGYAVALRGLGSKLVDTYELGEEIAVWYSDKQMQDLFVRIESTLEKFSSIENELVWFSLKKQKLTKQINLHFKCLYLNFIHSTISSNKEAVLYFQQYKGFEAMARTAIKLLKGTVVCDILESELGRYVKVKDV